MEFKLQNHNEFKMHMRWHDYLSIMLFDFPIFLIRKYIWLEGEDSETFLIQILGFTVVKIVTAFGM